MFCRPWSRGSTRTRLEVRANHALAKSFFRCPNQQDRERGDHDCDHEHDKRARIATANVMEETKKRCTRRADSMAYEDPQTAHRSERDTSIVVSPGQLLEHLAATQSGTVNKKPDIDRRQLRG